MAIDVTGYLVTSAILNLHIETMILTDLLHSLLSNLRTDMSIHVYTLRKNVLNQKILDSTIYAAVTSLQANIC